MFCHTDASQEKLEKINDWIQSCIIEIPIKLNKAQQWENSSKWELMNEVYKFMHGHELSVLEVKHITGVIVTT